MDFCHSVNCDSLINWWTLIASVNHHLIGCKVLVFSLSTNWLNGRNSLRTKEEKEGEGREGERMKRDICSIWLCLIVISSSVRSYILDEAQGTRSWWWRTSMLVKLTTLSIVYNNIIVIHHSTANILDTCRKDKKLRNRWIDMKRQEKIDR